MNIFPFLFLLLVSWSTAFLLQQIRPLSTTQLHFDLSDGETPNYRRRKDKEKISQSVATEALLLFSRHSTITTQQEVDDFYNRKWRRKDLKTVWNTSLDTFSNVEGTEALICILENAPWYEKHRDINFLGGSKTRYVKSALESNLEYLDHVGGSHLHRAVVNTLHSLVVVPMDDAAMLLSVAIKMLKLAHKHHIYFNEQDIATMLYGLQHLKSDVPRILHLLSTLTPDIAGLPDHDVTPRDLSMALYGVQGMNSKHLAVRRLLDVLVVKLSNCQQSFSAHDISMASYGLTNMNCSQPEVRKLLDVLADKITQSHGTFRANDVSVLLHGIQDMSSEYPEVRKLVGVLTVKAATCQEKFNRQQIKYALSALKGKSGRYDEMRWMLQVLVKKAKEYLQAIRVRRKRNENQ